MYALVCVYTTIHLYTMDPFLQFQYFHLSRVFVSSECAGVIALKRLSQQKCRANCVWLANSVPKLTR